MWLTQSLAWGVTSITGVPVLPVSKECVVCTDPGSQHTADWSTPSYLYCNVTVEFPESQEITVIRDKELCFFSLQMTIIVE